MGDATRVHAIRAPAGAESIARLTHLEELSLAQTGWVDDGFTQCLGTLSRLQTLNLSHCPDITHRSVQRFPLTFPALTRYG